MQRTLAHAAEESNARDDERDAAHEGHGVGDTRPLPSDGHDHEGADGQEHSGGAGPLGARGVNDLAGQTWHDVGEQRRVGTLEHDETLHSALGSREPAVEEHGGDP